MITFDLSLNNAELYMGCDIEEVAGRLNLKTPVENAVNIIGKNAAGIIDKLAGTDSEITLTGSMAVWTYLIIFHIVVHRFSHVYYNDGKGNNILIAAHGS